MVDPSHDVFDRFPSYPPPQRAVAGVARTQTRRQRLVSDQIDRSVLSVARNQTDEPAEDQPATPELQAEDVQVIADKLLVSFARELERLRGQEESGQ